MNKSYICLIVVSILLIIVTGCGYSKEEKEDMEKLKTQASLNALNYIKNKYNFSAKVISTEIEKEDTGPVINFQPKPTKYVFVNCEYNKKSFQVYIRGDEVTIDGVDNYQFMEIKNDIIKLINSKTGLEAYSSNIKYGKIASNPNGLIKELYTKNNLNEIINNGSNNFKILVSYINGKNLEFIKKNNLFKDIKNAIIFLVNFHDRKSYEAFKKQNYSEDIDALKEGAVNIESAYVLYNSEYYYKFDMKKIDNINYYYDGEAYKNFKLSITSISDVTNVSDYKKVTQIFPAYKINGTCTIEKEYEKLYIYIPSNKFSKYNLDNIEFVIETIDRMYLGSQLEKSGDYLVGHINIPNCQQSSKLKFTIVYSK